ncbi:MAG: thioredoxin family protein [Nitrososphaerales archaeon]
MVERKELLLVYAQIMPMAQDVNAKSWEEKVIRSELPVVVNFWAPQCGFCKWLEPLYERLSDIYKRKMVFLKLNVDDESNHEILHGSSIEGTPTLKFYCNGREVGEHVGYAIEPVLKKKIDTMLEEMESCLKNSTPLKRK